MLATDDEAVIDAYRRFGWALGLAFQLNDDLLGIWGDEADDGQGGLRHRRAQEDAAAHLRAPGGQRAPTPSACARSCARPTADAPPARSTEARAILERVGARDVHARPRRQHRDEALAEIDSARAHRRRGHRAPRRASSGPAIAPEPAGRGRPGALAAGVRPSLGPPPRRAGAAMRTTGPCARDGRRSPRR